MSIFGTQPPQFTSAVATCSLDNSFIKDANFSIPDVIEHTSVIDGTSTWTYKGDKSQFTVQVNLFKYADPQTKFLEILNYYQTDVSFWPFRNGKPIKGSTGKNIPFHIVGLNLYYQYSPAQFDTLDITFKSNAYTSISGSLV